MKGVVTQEVGCSLILQKTMPKKMGDPGSFMIPIIIGNQLIGKAFLDLGASINLIPLFILEKIGNVEVKETRMTNPTDKPFNQNSPWSGGEHASKYGQIHAAR